MSFHKVHTYTIINQELFLRECKIFERIVRFLREFGKPELDGK
jgi:hypothetical protein